MEPEFLNVPRRLFFDYEGDRLVILADEDALGIMVGMAMDDLGDVDERMVVFDDPEQVAAIRDVLSQWLEIRRLTQE